MSDSFLECVYNGDALNAEIALAEGASINHQNSFGHTALHLVAHSKNRDILKSLLDIKNIKLNQKDTLGQTALMFSLSFNPSYEFVDLLIQHGANPHIKRKNNEIPLEVAIKKGLDGIVALLLKHTHNIINFKKLITIARKQENKRILQRLKAWGMVHGKEKECKTPMNLGKNIKRIFKRFRISV